MSNLKEKKPNGPILRRWIGIGTAIGLFAFVILFLTWSEDTAEVTLVDGARSAQPVSVITLEAGEVRAEVSAFAEVRPQWDAEIRAAVSGRIIEVAPEALAGSRVEAGADLVRIEPAPYAAAVANAELALEEARLGHLTAQNHVTVARRQFERDGTEPPNELALRIPHLRIAERQLDAAQSQLNAARRQLADTRVTAPFSGYVTARAVSPGQTVSAGEPLLRISDNARFELTAELSQDDWQLLAHPVEGGEAELYLQDDEIAGVARIRRGGGYLDPDTRQMRIFLEIEDPPETVLSGDFLRVVFNGRPIPEAVLIPESAITREGDVWIVDDAGFLHRIEPNILFRTGSNVAIAAPDERGVWRVAVTPLASFLPGQQVSPVEREG